MKLRKRGGAFPRVAAAVCTSALLAALGASASGAPHVTAPIRPTVTPMFSAIVDGPAFFVECVNETGASLQSNAAHWFSALRVDGAILPDPGMIGAGLSQPVAPGATWRGIVALRPSGVGTFPEVKFGAMLRVSRIVSLAAGRHRFAIRCGTAWSDDVPFYWEI